MRTLFLFFLGINVLFFVWQSSSLNPATPPSKASLTAIPANVSKLILINENNKGPKEALSSKSKQSIPEQLSPDQARSELALPEEVEAAAAKTDTEIKTTALSLSLPPQKRGPGQYECFTLGPFKEATQATPIALKLRDLGAITRGRQHDKQVPSGYWVYLPRFSSWKAARRKVVELEKHGVRDTFIMGRGSLQNAVSAGLFTTNLAAENRLAQLKKLGANAKIQIQYTATPEFWIDIEVEVEKQQIISAIDAIAKGLTVLELLPHKCEAN